MAPTTLVKNNHDFDPKKFLATIGEGREVVAFPKRQSIFTQGDTADAIFYIQEGKVRLTVVSKIGKEATLGILSDGDFFGEVCLVGKLVRMKSATAMTDCTLLRVDKKAMMLALHREHTFSDLFVAYLLVRNIRHEEDLVDRFSIPAKSDWLGFCSCLPILVRKVCSVLLTIDKNQWRTQNEASCLAKCVENEQY